jgi:DNA helicase MCM8
LRNLKSHAEAIPVKNLKSHTVSDEETHASGNFEFQNCTERDLEFVVNYKKNHGADVFRHLLQSFCPSIYGHELVKGIFYLNNLFGILNLYYIG